LLSGYIYISLSGSPYVELFKEERTEVSMTLLFSLSVTKQTLNGMATDMCRNNVAAKCAGNKPALGNIILRKYQSCSPNGVLDKLLICKTNILNQCITVFCMHILRHKSSLNNISMCVSVTCHLKSYLGKCSSP
jgi:hypothetical protein